MHFVLDYLASSTLLKVEEGQVGTQILIRSGVYRVMLAGCPTGNGGHAVNGSNPNKITGGHNFWNASRKKFEEGKLGVMGRPGGQGGFGFKGGRGGSGSGAAEWSIYIYCWNGFLPYDYDVSRETGGAGGSGGDSFMINAPGGVGGPGALWKNSGQNGNVGRSIFDNNIHAVKNCSIFRGAFVDFIAYIEEGLVYYDIGTKGFDGADGSQFYPDAGSGGAGGPAAVKFSNFFTILKYSDVIKTINMHENGRTIKRPNSLPILGKITTNDNPKNNPFLIAGGGCPGNYFSRYTGLQRYIQANDIYIPEHTGEIGDKPDINWKCKDFYYPEHGHVILNLFAQTTDKILLAISQYPSLTDYINSSGASIPVGLQPNRETSSGNYFSFWGMGGGGGPAGSSGNNLYHVASSDDKRMNVRSAGGRRGAFLRTLTVGSGNSAKDDNYIIYSNQYNQSHFPHDNSVKDGEAWDPKSANNLRKTEFALKLGYFYNNKSIPNESGGIRIMYLGVDANSIYDKHAQKITDYTKYDFSYENIPSIN